MLNLQMVQHCMCKNMWITLARVQKSLKISGLDSRSSGTNKILIKKGFPSRKTRDVVGGGRPLRDEGSFSNTKRWTKELQRKYDSEQDPSVRKLIKEMGSELQSWVTEEEIEEARRLALKLEQGDDDDDDGKMMVSMVMNDDGATMMMMNDDGVDDDDDE